MAESSGGSSSSSSSTLGRPTMGSWVSHRGSSSSSKTISMVGAASSAAHSMVPTLLPSLTSPSPRSGCATTMRASPPAAGVGKKSAATPTKVRLPSSLSGCTSSHRILPMRIKVGSNRSSSGVEMSTDAIIAHRGRTSAHSSSDTINSSRSIRAAMVGASSSSIPPLTPPITSQTGRMEESGVRVRFAPSTSHARVETTAIVRERAGTTSGWKSGIRHSSARAGSCLPSHMLLSTRSGGTTSKIVMSRIVSSSNTSQ
mmetsp:Transcript_32048/g.94301  ORF Transcript_32048/g.94301 Transcript_32048/m.94301 type:complete len:257 (+) Transcript_32048:210-980(+)